MVWYFFFKLLRIDMHEFTRHNVAFYGDRNEIIELEKLFEDGNQEPFDKIIPIPNELLEKTEEEMTDWKVANWGVKWCKKVSSESVHMETYSIYRFEFHGPSQPPYSILRKILSDSSRVNIICSSHLESSLEKMKMLILDPERNTDWELLYDLLYIKEHNDESSPLVSQRWEEGLLNRILTGYRPVLQFAQQG